MVVDGQRIRFRRPVQRRSKSRGGRLKAPEVLDNAMPGKNPPNWIDADDLGRRLAALAGTALRLRRASAITGSMVMTWGHPLAGDRARLFAALNTGSMVMTWGHLPTAPGFAALAITGSMVMTRCARLPSPRL